MKVAKTKFQRDLKEAENEGNEADIRGLWIEEMRKVKPKAKIISTHNTDGILIFNNIHTLLEFKDKKGFKSKIIRCSVIMQALYYLHNIMESGDKIPSTIFVGDGSECFFLRSHVLAGYLNDRPDIDWSLAPSQAAMCNPVVLKHMNENPQLDSFVINVQSDTFRVKDIFPILEEFTKNYGKRIKIDEYNIISAFQYFKDSVVKSIKTTLDVDEKKRVGRLIDVFYNCITDRVTTMPNKKGNISTRGEEIQVHPEQHKAFFNLFEQDIYSISDKERLVAIKDQVLEEIYRRMTGSYFTPDLWIDKAHEMIAEQFGNDWKEKYVVWDCASGTNNLTRKYQFKELYNSTLEQGDVDTVNDMGYCGKTFQYDFLNDGGKLPIELVRDLTDKKPMLFLINPPYGTAKSGSLKKGENKKNIANTKTGNEMKFDKIGACSQQLYAQFLYKILKLKQNYNISNLNICIFSTPLFMSGEGYEKFRDVFYKCFAFKNGIMFQASQFAEVSGEWGISFTLWEGSCN